MHIKQVFKDSISLLHLIVSCSKLYKSNLIPFYCSPMQIISQNSDRVGVVSLTSQLPQKKWQARQAK